MIQYNCPYRVYSIGIYKKCPLKDVSLFSGRPLIIRHSNRMVLQISTERNATWIKHTLDTLGCLPKNRMKLVSSAPLKATLKKYKKCSSTSSAARTRTDHSYKLCSVTSVRVMLLLSLTSPDLREVQEICYRSFRS